MCVHLCMYVQVGKGIQGKKVHRIQQYYRKEDKKHLSVLPKKRTKIFTLNDINSMTADQKSLTMLIKLN